MILIPSVIDAQNLAFIFRQESHFCEKQHLNVPLLSYTENMIKKCQRLSITNNDKMNIYIHGLLDDIKTHVIKNQSESFDASDTTKELANLKSNVLASIYLHRFT